MTSARVDSVPARSMRSAACIALCLLSVSRHGGACRFRKPVKRVPGKYGLRYYKNVGLGFRTPKEAIEGALLTLATSRQTDVRHMYGYPLSSSATAQAVCTCAHRMSAISLATAGGDINAVMQAHTSTRSALSLGTFLSVAEFWRVW
jgi:hypothetical protein